MNSEEHAHAALEALERADDLADRLRAKIERMERYVVLPDCYNCPVSQCPIRVGNNTLVRGCVECMRLFLDYIEEG